MQIGEKITVMPTWMYAMPSWYKMQEMESSETLMRTGTVVYINEKHRFYVLEYPKGQREGFKIW